MAAHRLRPHPRPRVPRHLLRLQRVVAECLHPVKLSLLIDMPKILFIFFVFFVLGVGCSTRTVSPEPSQKKIIMAEKVTFTTSDGVEIVGDYVPADSSRTVILLHMMPATRGAWRPFVKKLNDAGLSTLAIDLRGHGDSIKKTTGEILNYKQFSDADHQASIYDVEAAASWLLREYGVGEEEIAFVGASIGANLSLQYLAEHKNVPVAVLLSPGLNYKGIDTQAAIVKVQPTQSIFFVGAQDDAYASLTIQYLIKETEAQKEVKNYDGGGHGTNLFDSQPKLMDEIVEWLKLKLK